jgi:CheY-like chemotaxis protein
LKYVRLLIKYHAPPTVVKKTGFKLLRAIRALGPDLGGSVPVVAMTAFSVHEDRAHILSAEFQACLLKPFTPEELLETILAILKSD